MMIPGHLLYATNQMKTKNVNPNAVTSYKFPANAQYSGDDRKHSLIEF